MIKRVQLKIQDRNRIWGPNTANDSSRSLRKPTIPVIDAVLMALEAVGDPTNRGKGGAVGYCKWLATTEPRAFAMLLLRILPLQPRREEINYENTDKQLLAKIFGVIERSHARKVSGESESSADQGCIDATAREAGVGQNAGPEGDARLRKDV
jgi:hypothetical protein